MAVTLLAFMQDTLADGGLVRILTVLKSIARCSLGCIAALGRTRAAARMMTPLIGPPFCPFSRNPLREILDWLRLPGPEILSEVL